MGRRMNLGAVTDDERQAVKRLAHARTAPARAVERARVVLAALEGQLVEDIAVDQRLSRTTVYLWGQRFEERGVAGLEDRSRPGRPRTYPGQQVGEIVATALSAPTTLGLPCASWTLDRLVAYLSTQTGLTMQRSRRDEVLVSAGCAGAKRRRGSVSGSIPTVPQKEFILAVNPWSAPTKG